MKRRKRRNERNARRKRHGDAPYIRKERKGKEKSDVL
jgi:hypothetical protein